MCDLYSRIYSVVQQIPPGRVTTYGAIARFLGSAQGARMVGWAMNQSHSCESYVPAHRVVNRMGRLTGKHHFPGSSVMEELLESEGIQVIEDQVQNFQHLFWDPAKELSIDSF